MKYPQRSFVYPERAAVRPRVLMLAAALFAAMCLARPASAQDSTSESNGRLHGIVMDSVTHQPVARALVSSPDSRFATLTDHEGRFEFTFPKTPGSDPTRAGNPNPNRPVALLARKPGFLPDPAPQDLSAITSEQSLILTLVPEALIVGKVSLPNSEAPESIFLQLYRRQVQDGTARWFVAGGAQSRSDGEFRFADLPAGTYKVLTREQLDRDPASFDPQGQQYGYPPAYGQNAPDFDSSGTIRVTAGTTGVANLSLTKKRYYRIHLPVANLPPDTGLNIVVFPSGHGGPGYSLGYNNRDQAIEGLLPDGSYTVQAASYSAGQNTGTGSLTIAVNGAPVRGPVMTLAPNSPIRVDVKEEFTSADNTGTILNTGGRSILLRGPRRYLNILLEPADDSGRAGPTSLRGPTGPADDVLMIEPTQPGRYWVRAITSHGYVASLRSGNVDLRYEPLAVSSGGAMSPIEVTVRDDTAEIDGTVEGISASANTSGSKGGGASDSGPIASPGTPAHVYFIPLPEGGGQFAEAWTSPDGSFNSPPLAPGTYRVVAFDRPQSEIEYRNPQATREYDGKGPTVRLFGGQKERVQLQLVSTNE